MLDGKLGQLLRTPETVQSNDGKHLFAAYRSDSVQVGIYWRLFSYGNPCRLAPLYGNA